MVSDVVNRDKPLAYVLGKQPFHPLQQPLLVRPPTLIPRPETENWVTLLASRLSSTRTTSVPFRILDIGTGTGCIALALTAHLRSRGLSVRTTAVDRAPCALALATENVARQSLSESVSVRQADLFSTEFAAHVGAPYDLVVSNPPYITRGEYATLDASVRAWEDRGALVGERDAEGDLGDDDGLLFYRRIVSLLADLLAPSGERGPVVALEVGQGQARAVERMLRGWRSAEGAQLDTEVVQDPWGIERAVFASWRI